MTQRDEAPIGTTTRGTPISERNQPPVDDGASEQGFVKQAFITGFAVLLPLIVTLLVLGFAVNFLSQQLDPLVGGLQFYFGTEIAPEVVLKLLVAALLLVMVFLVGAWAESRPEGAGVNALFDMVVYRIPGIGSLYRSVNEMMDLLLDSDTDSFQEVVLVEFPDRGSYAVSFLTARTPDMVPEATDHDGMLTVFLPMAPNPVMGGYVIHVDEEQVYEVDMTVEEGIQSIVTSGVAIGHNDRDDLPMELRERFDRRVQSIEETMHVDKIGKVAVEVETRLEDTARDTANRITGYRERMGDRPPNQD